MEYLIKDASKKLNISIYTLRYYDKEGLTPFVRKDENGVRKYTEEDLEWIRMLINLRDIDMPISNIKEYKLSGYPLLLGTSRKRVIGEYSHQAEPKNRVYGNIAADTLAVLGGADIFRIHDVKNEKQGIYMAYALKSAQNNSY